MLNRHQSREVIIQALFNFEFRNISKTKHKEVLKYVLNEFYPEVKEDQYSEEVFSGILDNKEKIDEIITNTVSNGSLEKVDAIDRNILRLGIFEMLFSEEVPPRVAMNEAIELAKSFGGKNSFKFISGVLGTIYEVADLQKNDRDLKMEKAALEDLPVKYKYGTLVFSEKDGKVFFAFVYDIFGYWTLPKGGSDDKNLSPKEIAQDKTFEEIGVDALALEEIGKISFAANDKEKNLVRKEVVYFLAKSNYQKLLLDKNNKGLVDAKWIEKTEIQKLKIYKDLNPIIKKGINLVEEKYVG